MDVSKKTLTLELECECIDCHDEGIYISDERRTPYGADYLVYVAHSNELCIGHGFHGWAPDGDAAFESVEDFMSIRRAMRKWLGEED